MDVISFCACENELPSSEDFSLAAGPNVASPVVSVGQSNDSNPHGSLRAHLTCDT